MYSCHLNRILSKRIINRAKDPLTSYVSCENYFWKKSPPPKEEGSLERGLDKDEVKALVEASKLFKQPAFNKDREGFIGLVEEFTKGGRFKKRQGQVEFIRAALRHMEQYGVHRDLEAYKALMDVFPKGRMVPTNMFQVGGIFYAKFQWCALDILNKLEHYNLQPDQEMEYIIVQTFGRRSLVWEKVARQLYWNAKLKNANPYPMPEHLPQDGLELAKVALKRMSPDLQTRLQVLDVSRLSCI